MEELSKYGITERGNTALFEADSEGGAAFFAEISEGKWLQVTMCTENYPAWNIAIKDKTLAEMRTHIEENFGNYYFQKNNIGANAYGRMPADKEYVMDTIRDHYHIYSDGITGDTVAFIHNALESRKWTLDITDIETLRKEFDS